MQEKLIANAVKFLTNPKVAGSDKEKLIEFLKAKGLTDADIAESFKRVEEKKTAKVPGESGLSLEPPKPSAVAYSPVPMQTSSILNLSYTNISVFPPLHARASLKILIFSFNSLESIPKEISLLNSLEVLNLSNNKISNSGIPSIFFTLHSLHELNLSSNKLTSLEGFSQLNNLQKLNVSNNEIETIPDDFFNLQELRYLWIYKNKLNELPRSIAMLSSLKQIVIYI